MNRSRICVVSPLYHPSLGGLGRQAQLLTERLSKEGIEVFVIARRMIGMPHAEFSPNVQVYRTWSIKPEVITYERVSFRNVFISFTFAFSCALNFFRLRKRYDIVHFHGASLPLLMNIPVLKCMGKKIIAKVASAKLGIEAGSVRGRYAGLGTVLAWIFRMVDRYVAISSEIADGLLNDRVSEGKIVRIPNFIDTERFAPSVDDKKEKRKAALGLHGFGIVTFSGRFIERKGIDTLLAAWKKVQDRCRGTRLVLLGDGPLLGKMKALAKELGVEGTTAFPGHINRVIDYLEVTDVYVLPSLQEGMPNALLEAMACGPAPVATRIGGVVDIIRDGENGIIVEPGDAQALAAGILKLLQDKDLARDMGLNAYKTVKDFYSLDGIVSKYIDLYQDV